MSASDMRRCMDELDVPGVRKLWAHVRPGMPQPRSDAEALIILHHARTQSPLMTLRKRAYSHRWLLDNGYPSGLPIHLRSEAERLYPQVADSVGIAVSGVSDIGRQIAPIVQGAMSDAVLDAYAEGRREPVFVRERMMDARRDTVRRLIGK